MVTSGNLALVNGLDHPALVYGSLDEFLVAMVPYVAEGIDRGEPVFAAVGPEEVSALRAEIGEVPGVQAKDTNEWHPVPATRLRAFHIFVNEQLRAGARRIRLAGEPVWGAVGRPEFIREWARYESILNAVLEPFPVTLVCTYPASRLDPAIVQDAHRTHPSVGINGGSHPSESFEDPAVLVGRWNPPLSPPPADAQRAPQLELTAARAFVTEEAERAGVSPGRTMDLELATSEIASNALFHGGGAATLLTWRDGDYLICQIEDEGPGLADVLAGYRPPSLAQESGRGLWLARQVVDLLQIVPTPTGTAVRLYVRIAG
ncbi:MAG: sensor histidine kinase [Actinomycetota bacterium]